MPRDENRFSASESETDLAPDSDSEDGSGTFAAPDTGPVPTPKSNILLGFCSSDSASERKGDILLQFGSDNGEDIDNAGGLHLSAQAGGMRKSGEKYTEFDFDFLDHKWLELSDEGSDHIDSSSSSSTD